MIDPKDFYESRDIPSEASKQAMWENISAGLSQPTQTRLLSLEKRSFLFGMAATILLAFTAIGIYTTVARAIDLSQPSVVKIDRAYQSAITAFERVALDVEAVPSTSPSVTDLRTARRLQLQELETAITLLRTDTRSGDLSPMRRAKLRELYAKKLSLLQTMLEQGDLEL